MTGVMLVEKKGAMMRTNVLSAIIFRPSPRGLSRFVDIIYRNHNDVQIIVVLETEFQLVIRSLEQLDISL